MGRFLFVVPPFTGHVNPTVSLGGELLARGHAVTWTGHAEVLADVLPGGATFVPVADALPAPVLDAVDAQPAGGHRGVAALRFLWRDVLVPLARQMLPGVHAAVDAVDPDVVLVDQQALAGAAVAEVRARPWATVATTSAELTDPLAGMGKVDAWVRDLIRQVLAEAGLDASRAAAVDPRFSPHLVLALTTEALVGAGTRFPGHYAFVGPVLTRRPDETPFAWEWLDRTRPLVFVSLGTLNWRVGARFFGIAAEAVGDLDVQAVFVAPPDLVPHAPANVLVAPRVPQLPLLARASAVVSHGGHNTVCEALAHGLPLVVAPIRDDQPIVADQVVRAGAGVRVKFGRVTPALLRRAIDAVLAEPAYREGAATVRDSFAAAGGVGAAADRLEALVRTAPDRVGRTSVVGGGGT
jgi:MGT family glycosyltransferase